MPRIARKNMISSYIHVITQGINKEEIFKKSKYKNKYIELVEKTFEKYSNLYLLGYCIMDNHAHFLIYTKDYEILSKAMLRINTAYGIFYNREEERVGYVFRDRYYTQQIKDERHLHNAIVYIHRNPVKANLVSKMDEYEYSSYCQYQKGDIAEKCIKLLFHTKEYKKTFEFIHRNFKEEGDIFDIEKVQINFESVEKFIENYCKKIGIEKEEIKKNNYLIIKIMKEIKKEYFCNEKEIAKLLGIGKNRISKIKQRLEECPPNP